MAREARPVPPDWRLDRSVDLTADLILGLAFQAREEIVHVRVGGSR